MTGERAPSLSTFGAQSKRDQVIAMFSEIQQSSLAISDQLDVLQAAVDRFIQTSQPVTGESGRLSVDPAAWQTLRALASGPLDSS